MIDFEHVNVLPVSFTSFALHVSADKFVSEVAQKLDFARSPILRVLTRAAGLIMQISDKSLGDSSRAIVA